MGNKQSTPAAAGGAGASKTPETSKAFDWGQPPEYPPEDEIGTEELAFQSWAYCKAKPTPAKHFRSDAEEKERRKALNWRKRPSFLELDCGEDSFFVSNTYRAIGMADGVGGWKQDGIDPTMMPNALMKAAKLFTETHRKVDDPEVIMQQAYDKVVAEDWVPGGSSTMCVATLRDKEGGTYLDIANLGDTGVMVVRDRQMVYRVHEKVHSLASPFQMSVVPKGWTHKVFSDSSADSIRESFQVKEGDVIVMGTDGLFDNRFSHQISETAAYVCPNAESVLNKIPIVGMVFGAFLDTKIEYVDPYKVTQRLVDDAYKASVGKKGETPWAHLLKDFGVQNIEGGKVDDITCLVAKVTTRAEMMTADIW